MLDVAPSNVAPFIATPPVATSVGLSCDVTLANKFVNVASASTSCDVVHVTASTATSSTLSPTIPGLPEFRHPL